MAEGQGALYNEFKYRLATGAINLTSDTIKVALVSGYTPNIDTHNTWANVSSGEISGTGYTAGGQDLASVTWTKNNTDNRAELDAANTTWTALNAGTPSHLIMYDDTASDYLMAYWEVTTPSNGGNYTIQWGTAGIVLVT